MLPLVSLLIFLPLAGALAAYASGKNARQTALFVSLLELAVSVWVAAFQFVPANGTQLTENYWWIQSLGISYKVGMDGISLLLVLLTSVLVPIIIQSSARKNYDRPGLFYFLVLLMQSALVGVFTALDGFLFYIFWELALIPIYLICLIWGGEQRLRITLKFFIYTLFGSLLMLVALIWLRLQTPAPHSFDIDQLYGLQLSPTGQALVFWALFIAFAIKMPVFPFHTWQPDTYTDSPTQGTMLLSGIMLKMGVYGVIRWLLPVVPDAVETYGPIVMVLCITGIVYASLIAWVQSDFKRLIAYSSIAHVGLIAAGVFSLNMQGLQGSVIQMLSHGINVVGLFFVSDLLMQRIHTRDMDKLGGIRHTAPVFATSFMIVLLASVALPLTNGFVGEFLLINGVFQYSAWMAAVAGLTVIFGAVYMLIAYQKIALGPEGSVAHRFHDLDLNEKLVLFPLIGLIFWLGVYPQPVIDLVEPSVKELLDTINQSGATTLR